MGLAVELSGLERARWTVGLAFCVLVGEGGKAVDVGGDIVNGDDGRN